MRPSEMGRLAQCEALWLAHAPKPGPMSAAAYVGKLAHSALTGTEQPIPDRVAWDDITRTQNDAACQAEDLLWRATELIRDADSVIILTETDTHVQVGDLPVAGRYDLLLGTPNGKAVVDFKTGRTIGGAWLQVGGYLLDSDLAAYDGGVLHIPRSRHAIGRTGSLTFRQGRGLRLAAQALAERGSNIVGGAAATRTPGRHCAGCPLTDCAVRA